MILSKLTPAETLMVWKGNLTPLKDLLKYTLMDLLLKQILAIDEVERQPSKRDPIRVYKYIGTGRNFRGYSHLPHELIFLSPFHKNSDIRILFRNFVKVAYENARSEKAFYKTVMSCDELKGVFSMSIFQRIMGGFNYTSLGSQLCSQIKKEIEDLEKILPELNKRDKKKALEILKLIGGNIFLFKGVEFSLLKEIDEELIKELTRQQPNSGGCSTGCWTTFDTLDSDFDSSCSSDSSGCWGDGGCGGDSGGGGDGCGGCGGD